MFNSIRNRLIVSYILLEATLLIGLVIYLIIGNNSAFPGWIIWIILLVVVFLQIIWVFQLSRYFSKSLNYLQMDLAKRTGRKSITLDPTGKLDEVEKLSLSFQHFSEFVNNQLNEMNTEREMLNAVLSNMTDGVMIVDSEGKIQMTNPAALSLFSAPYPVVGYSLVEIVRHHQLVELWQKCQHTQVQQTATLETSLDRLFIQGIATPLGDIMPGAILLVVQDLTRVRRLETVRKDFVSNVSHELRTPLASIKALAETLREGALDDPPAAQRFLSRMESEIDNLTQMVQELLELSRIESGRVPLERKNVPPIDLVTSTVERMSLQAERAGLTLTNDCPVNLPLVHIDFQRMSQVLINLIHNAIKFTPPGGKISVSAYVENEKVIFYVKDNGVGIPQEALERIFERFFKTDRARSGGGTGLGLSISRHLVEAHNGQIWAESSPQEGSTFFFSIPATLFTH